MALSETVKLKLAEEQRKNALRLDRLIHAKTKKEKPKKKTKAFPA